MLFYQKVIAYCEKHKLTVAAFEAKCGLANGTVNGWKNGSNPSLASLQKISNATKISTAKWLKM